jgi:Flp pilus assembly pilin Flp
MKTRYRRRGMSQVQWCLLAALITLGVVAGVTLLGNRTNTKLGETASDLANPQNLTKRFGS